MIFDTHIHLNDEKLYSNLDEYIKSAQQKNVGKFLCVGWDLESSKKAIEIAHKYPNVVYAAVAIMPTEHKSYNDNSIEDLRNLAKDPCVRAIGEIGLDYYWENSPEIKEKQKKMFIEQIKLANELDLPISVHCREAVQDTYDILKNFHVKRKSILHCYSGSLEMAKLFKDINFVFGFGGTLTYKNNKNAINTFDNIGLENVVFETDAPYLPPQDHRGKLNKPEYIYETVLFASNRKNMNIEDIEKVTTENANNIFSRGKNQVWKLKN